MKKAFKKTNQFWINFKNSVCDFFHVTYQNAHQGIWQSKRHILRITMIFLIPFLYSFTYLAAFWNPFDYSKNIQVAVVNNDPQGSYFQLIQNKVGSTESFQSNGQTYSVTIDYQPNYSQWSNNKDKYAASIVIPENFSQNVENYLTYITTHKGPIYQMPKMDFYSSFKSNYVVGEISQIGSYILQLKVNNIIWVDLLNTIKTTGNATSLIQVLTNLEKYFPEYKPLFEQWIGEINKDPGTYNLILSSLTTLLKNMDPNTIVNPFAFNNHEEGSGYIDKYGFGLAPFFICIGIWMGSMFACSTVLRRNKDDKVGFLKHYFANSLIISTITILQTIFMIATLMGLGLILNNEAALFGFGILIAIAFGMMCQAIMFIPKIVEVGRYICILLLILQITSSGGIFPLYLQPAFFGYVSHVSVFYYVINAIRELYINFNGHVFGMNVLGIIVITTVFILINFSFHYGFKYYRNKKMLKLINAEKENKTEIK